jgi:hypothetical protein
MDMSRAAIDGLDALSFGLWKASLSILGRGNISRNIWWLEPLEPLKILNHLDLSTLFEGTTQIGKMA